MPKNNNKGNNHKVHVNFIDIPRTEVMVKCRNISEVIKYALLRIEEMKKNDKNQ